MKYDNGHANNVAVAGLQVTERRLWARYRVGKKISHLGMELTSIGRGCSWNPRFLPRERLLLFRAFFLVFGDNQSDDPVVPNRKEVVQIKRVGYIGLVIAAVDQRGDQEFAV